MFSPSPALIFWMLLFQSGVSQDIASLKARAQEGDTTAQVQLGVAYASGDGVTADDAEAVEWFRKAAQKGDAAGEYSLGEMYLTGRGLATDAAEGWKWLRRSAEHGDRRGQFNLAVFYAQGQGVPKDESESAKMRKAAEQGLAAAQFGLGSMYAHGSGVPRSDTEAVRWYRKATDQGDSASMNNLAFLLASSTDPRIHDPKEAVAIAQKAVQAEYGNATYLDTLAGAYFEAGEPGKAAETERRALALKPENPSYKKALDRYLNSAMH